jgi:hypothetical protein
MKKTLIIIISLMLAGSLVMGAEETSKKFRIQLEGTLLMPADGNYKDVYGSTVFYPGIEAGFSLSDNFFLWFGFGYLSKSGTTPVLEEEASSTQNILGLGGGYQGDFSEKLGFRVQAGILYISYKEEALGEEVSDSAIGFGLEGSLVMNFSDTIFGLVFLGYDYASDDVEGVNIKLGGFKIGLGLGIHF